MTDMKLTELFRIFLKKGFVSKRLLFVGNLDEWENNVPPHPDYDVWVVEEIGDERLGEEHVQFLFENTASGLVRRMMPFVPDSAGEEHVIERFESADCILFLVVERDSETPVGYTWTLIPSEDTFALDLRIDEGTCFGFDAFTAPGHRRRGVTTLCRAVANDYAVERGCETLVGHVDAANKPALKAEDTSLLDHAGNNYLIRVLGLRLFSITSWFDVPGLELYLLPGRPQLR